MSTPWTSRALRACALACPLVALYWLRGLEHPQLDEWVHVAQVQLLLEGSGALHERLTVLPGLHVVVAAVAALGADPLLAGRFVVAATGVTAVGAALALAGRLTPDRASYRALAVAVFPLAAPLFSVFYTDVPALACLLLALVAVQRERVGLGAVALTAMLAVRHSTAALVPFVAIAGAPRPLEWSRSRARLWLLAPLALLALVIGWGGGLSLGDAANHPVGVFGANLPFAAALAFVLFLPSHLRAIPDVLALVRRAPVASLVWTTAAVGLALTADASHPFNDPSLDRLLYVGWIDALFRTPSGRVALATATALAPLSFATWRWRLAGFAWLAPLAAARLGASWLVEPRYALPFLALVLLARPKEPRWMEGGYVLAYGAASAYLLDGLAREQWFPL